MYPLNHDVDSIIWYRMKRIHILLRYDHKSIEFFQHSYIVNYIMNINNVSYQTSFDPPWIQCLSPGGVPWSLCGTVVHTTCPWTTSIVHNRIWPSRIWQPLHRRPAGPVKEDRMIALGSCKKSTSHMINSKSFTAWNQI